MVMNGFKGHSRRSRKRMYFVRAHARADHTLGLGNPSFGRGTCNTDADQLAILTQPYGPAIAREIDTRARSERWSALREIKDYLFMNRR